MRVVVTPLLFWAHGFCLTPNLVFLQPARKDDKALLEHEKVHAAQMQRVGMLAFWWRYLTDPKFRLTAELEAYRVQLRMQPGRVNSFAETLATKYRLNITAAEARKMLLT